MSNTREEPRLREDLREARRLLDDKCRLVSAMQHALGMNCTDGMDGDPVEWCRHIRERLDVLEAFWLVVAKALEDTRSEPAAP